MNRLGILGGAFDPPHNGHLALARGAVEHFRLERVVVLVAGRPGHKEVVLDAPTRLRLARAAFADVPGATVVLDEHARTIDALADGRYDGAVLIVGADEFAGFLAWKEPDRVLEHVRLGVGTRPGHGGERLEQVLRKLQRPDRVEFFELDEPVDLSSTEIRQRAARGERIDDLVPPAVARLVSALGSYQEPRVHWG